MTSDEHNLKLLHLGPTNSIFGLQKCYLSCSLQGKLPFQMKTVNYVAVPVSDCRESVCKLYWSADLHESFCQVDSSVTHNAKGIAAETLPSSKNPHRSDSFKLSDIQLLPAIVNMSDIKVTPVMCEVRDCVRWKNQDTCVLSGVLRDILRLFVLTRSCIVNLRNLKDAMKFGVDSVIIHSFNNNRNGDFLCVGKVISSTAVHIAGFVSKRKFDRVCNKTSFQALGGLNVPYNMLKDIIVSSKKKGQKEMVEKLGLCPSQQVLLVGPSGCGKTTLVLKMAHDCNAALVTILGPEVCRPRPGETEAELRKVFEEATQLAEEDCCILLLDEVDSLCPDRTDSASSSHGARITSQLLSLLEQVSKVAGLVVVATTNRPHALDPALRRHGRLETEIQIGIPTEQDRVEILDVQLMLLSVPDHVELCAQVARLTPGYVGADLALVCQDAVRRRFQRSKQGIEHAVLSLEDFRSAVGNIRPSLLRGGLGVVASTPAGLARIGGLARVKQALKAAVEWPLTHPEAFDRLGVPQPKGVLLYGPPGCAKTTIAQAIAAANNTNFLSVSAAELYSPFVGDAEKNIGELFHRARLGAPSIVFIDEIDALVGSRSEREKGVQERVLSALLTEMDGIGVRLDDSVNTTRKVLEGEAVGPQVLPGECVVNRGVVVIGATNRPEMIDSALLRPGRFDKLVHVPAPDYEDRLDILRVVMSTMLLASDVDLSALALQTPLFSGADLGNLAKEAGLCALTEEGMDVPCIQQKHFLCALERIQPSLSQEQVDGYLRFQ